jgi:NADH dehydrogenase FAD-containing subunit
MPRFIDALSERQITGCAVVLADPELRHQLLTLVVGGGGFSGVEVMAQLNDFVHSVKTNYLRLHHQPLRCVIIQAGDRILPEMSETLVICPENFAEAQRRNYSQ